MQARVASTNQPMRILFLTDNFPPETNAPATRTHEHTRRWAAAGHEVTVITCAPNFPGGKLLTGYRNKLWQTEVIDGVKVIRVWTYITANEGFLKRTADYVSFMVTGVLAGVVCRRPDVIVATSPQFFCALGGWLLSVLKWRPFVFELRDLWPDSILAVGAMRDSPAIRMLRRIEYFLYRRAALIVSVTHSFKTVLSGNGIDAQKIVVVPNGVDPAAFSPGPRPQALEEQLGLASKFVAAYVGTLGMAHGLAALLDAAELLKDDERIVFVLVGAGAERNYLIEEAKRRGLDRVLFVGPVDKETVKQYWRLADVALVLLRDTPLFRHVIPSKMFEAMGTGRPIILGVRGESAGILDRAKAGVTIEPENAAQLAQAIRRLADDPGMVKAIGASGREFVVGEFDRERLAAAMLDAIGQIAVARKAR
jgi:glycosyltransferase involved in cell wall biosynthesis